MPDLSPFTPWLALAGAVGLLVAVFASILALRSTAVARQAQRRLDNLLRHSQATDIEQLLHEQWEVLRGAQRQAEEAAGRLNRVEAALARAIQRVGVVRYNAFPGAGAELSFSVALLDPARDGVVISGLYGREETRIYAKPIAAGASRYPLSEEEREAIRAAVEVNVT